MIFNIENSNSIIPFYYKLSDFKDLLKLVFENDYESEYKQHIISYEGKQVIQELKNDWYPTPDKKMSAYDIIKSLFKNHKQDKKINVANFDELVIYKFLIEMFGVGNVICQQKLFGNKAYDFVVQKNEINYFLEFDGIVHFVEWQYADKCKLLEKKNLLKSRQENFKNHLKLKKSKENGYTIENSKIIFWPYWIKKCKLNFEIIFNNSNKNTGIGAIYSSNRHFGEFPWDGTSISNGISSSQLILDYNKQFNISENLIGGFYNQNSVLLKKSKEQIEKLLIPKGFENKNYWLPKID